ncbi:MAG: apolipoprotein N-acyltransferase [Elusimicrobia bacterium]|nr:apolipoprotein N-acyltransferase [Elusimicrobiota bacterium]
MLRKITPAAPPALSGLLLILCFPNWDYGWLAWFALIPLLYSLTTCDLRPTTAFFHGWLCGFIWKTGSLHWVLATHRYAGVPWSASAGGLLLLAAYLALYLGLFALAVAFFRRRSSHWTLATACAACWTLLEYLQEYSWHPSVEFPWGFLGYSQWRHPALIQTAALWGVYGVSFLLVGFNALAVCVLFPLQKQTRKLPIAGAALSLFLLNLGFGLYVLKFQTPSSSILSNPPSPRFPREKKIRVTLLQPDIEQYKKWSPQYEAEVKKTTEELLREASKNPADLVIWPEASIPQVLQEKDYLPWLQKLIRQTKRAHLVGALTRNLDRYHNSAALFDPKGNLRGLYHKNQLVPFGEYVPLRAFLGRWIAPLGEMGEMQPGKSLTPLPTPFAALGVSICYEMIFPKLIREQVRQGADLLVNLTNDGWYLGTSQPRQHLSMNVLRAVENRRFLLRATNTGISATIDPWGRILQQTSLDQRTYLSFSLSLPASQGFSFYCLRGDLLIGLSILFLLLSLFTGQAFGKQQAPPHEL